MRVDDAITSLDRVRPSRPAPLALGGRDGFWVAVGLRQASCSVGPGTLTAVRIRYRVVGAIVTQRLALDRPVTRRCPGAPIAS